MSEQSAGHNEMASSSTSGQSAMVPAIIFTDNAAAKVAELMCEENNPKLNLRVFITGGGCSGFEYGLTFDEIIDEEEDTVITKETVGSENAPAMTVRLVVDFTSLQYLKGVTIDYKEDLEGARFVFQNPNAKTTCSCGSSFDVE